MNVFVRFWGCATFTELHPAAEFGKVDEVRRLIHNKTNVDKEDIHGETLTMVATRICRYSVVQILIHANADVNKSYKFGRSPLLSTMRQTSSPSVNNF